MPALQVNRHWKFKTYEKDALVKAGNAAEQSKGYY